MRILIGLVALGLLELYLLLMLADLIGGGGAFLLVIGTGVLGAGIGARQMFLGPRRLHRALQEGRTPDQELLDASLIALGGFLLFLPGVLSDVAGCGLLLPPLRRLVGRRWIRGKRPHRPSPNHPPRDEVIDSFVVARRESDLS